MMPPPDDVTLVAGFKNFGRQSGSKSLWPNWVSNILAGSQVARLFVRTGAQILAASQVRLVGRTGLQKFWQAVR